MLLYQVAAVAVIIAACAVVVEAVVKIINVRAGTRRFVAGLTRLEAQAEEMRQETEPTSGVSGLN